MALPPLPYWYHFLNSIAQHTAIIAPPPPPLSPPPPNKLFIYFFHSGKKRGHYVKACFEAEAHMLYIVVSQNQTFNEHHKHKISWNLDLSCLIVWSHCNTVNTTDTTTCCTRHHPGTMLIELWFQLLHLRRYQHKL